MSCIGFKSHKVLGNMFRVPWHPKLIDLFIWLVCSLNTNGGEKCTVTSAWRPIKIHPNDSGIHITNPLRAFDMRSSGFDDPEDIATKINQCWIYDYDRMHMKTCRYHNVGQGDHFHFQVHDHTMLIKNLGDCLYVE